MAGALGLVALATSSPASAAVDGSTTSTATFPYLVNTQALINRGAVTAGSPAVATVAASWTAARIVSTGPVAAYGRHFTVTAPATTAAYKTSGAWVDINGTAVFGLSEKDAGGAAPSPAAADDFVALYSPTAVSATVQFWADSNSDGQINIVETASASATKTISFVAASSVSVEVAPAASYVSPGTVSPATTVTTTFTVTPKSGGAALNQNESNNATGTRGDTWKLGAFYTLPGSTTVTGVLPSPATAAQFTSPAIDVGTTAGTMSITGYWHPTGTFTSSPAPTTVPSGATSGAATVNIGTQAPLAANSKLEASGTGVQSSGTTSYRAAVTTKTVTWTATVKDNATTPAPIANAAVKFRLERLSGTVKVKINGGTEKTLDATTTNTDVVATTNASGVATISVEITAPFDATTGSPVTDGTTYRASVIDVSGTAFSGVTKTIVWEGAGTVSATNSSATVNGLPMDGTVRAVDFSTVTFAVTLKDTFGDAIFNRAVKFTSSVGGLSISIPTDASGVASFTLPATMTDQTITAATTESPAAVFTKTVVVDFDTAAKLTAASVTHTVPNAATVIKTTLGATPIAAAADGAPGGTTQLTFLVKNAAGEPIRNSAVTMTVTNGVLFAGSSPVGEKISAGLATAVVKTDNNGLASIWVATAGSGAVVVKATSGSVSASSSNITATNAAAPVKTLDLGPAAGVTVPSPLYPGTAIPMTVSAKDENGNGVFNRTIQVQVVGNGNLANGGQTLVGQTDSTGKLTFEFIAGQAGAVSVAAGTVNANGVQVISNVVSLEVTAAPAVPTVVIVGGRDGKKLTVAGTTTNVPDGGRVGIWARKAGTSEWVRLARVAVDENGDFSWTSIHDKTAQWTIYVKRGAVTSNRVVIPAYR